MFVVAAGAGVQNFLVALAGERLGSGVGVVARCSAATWCARCWGCRTDWDPMGAVAVGHPAAPPRERPPRGPEAFIEVR